MTSIDFTSAAVATQADGTAIPGEAEMAALTSPHGPQVVAIRSPIGHHEGSVITDRSCPK